jgi:hypothetical protein
MNKSNFNWDLEVRKSRKLGNPPPPPPTPNPPNREPNIEQIEGDHSSVPVAFARYPPAYSSFVGGVIFSKCLGEKFLRGAARFVLNDRHSPATEGLRTDEQSPSP